MLSTRVNSNSLFIHLLFLSSGRSNLFYFRVAVLRDRFNHFVLLGRSKPFSVRNIVSRRLFCVFVCTFIFWSCPGLRSAGTDVARTKRVVFVGSGSVRGGGRNFPRNGNLVFLIFVEAGRAPRSWCFVCNLAGVQGGRTSQPRLGWQDPVFQRAAPGIPLPAARR
jgi:hypothetical protein